MQVSSHELADRAEAPQLLSRPKKFRTLSTALLLVLLAAGINSLVRNPNLEWPVVADYITADAIMRGLWTTIWLTAVTFVIGFALGLPIALMRLSDRPLLNCLGWAYVWIFRSTPLLVQLLVWFNIAALYPRISIGVPFGQELGNTISAFGGPNFDLEFASFESQALIGVMLAAVLALSLDTAAYAGEIIRGGINSVDEGQIEAAHSLGIPQHTIILRIVLPQAMVSITPSAVNLLINVLKGTTLVSIIAVRDLLYTAQIIYLRTYQIIPLLLVATLWYLLICGSLSAVQYYVERRFARGTQRNMPPTPLQQFRGIVRTKFSKERSMGRRTGGHGHEQL